MSNSYRALILRAGWSAKTNRFFPRQALQNMADKFIPCFGEYVYGHEKVHAQVDISRVSHKTTKVFMGDDGVTLWAEIQPLSTERGNMLREFMKGNLVDFVAQMFGNLNRFDEVIPDQITLLHVAAHEVTAKSIK